MFKVVRRVSNEYLIDENGNASIEYVLIISMIVTMVFTVLVGLKNEYNTNICYINCTIVESEYKNYLNKSGIVHSDIVYSQFINKHGNEICPENNIVTYINGKIQCNGHYKDENIDDNGGNQDETVPFL